MDITRSIPCDFCGVNRASGVWGRHLYCWTCFQNQEPPDTSVEEFERWVDELLESRQPRPREERDHGTAMDQ